MNVLFQLGHPAHYHLFRNTIDDLRRDGHSIFVLIRKKDILEDLLKASGLQYHNILPTNKKGLLGYARRVWRVLRFARQHHIDVLVGSTPEVAIVAKLLRRRSVILAEDDAAIVPQFVRAVRPFVDCYLSPTSCNTGPLESYTTHYAGFQKLAYLHPSRFTPNPSVVDRYFPPSQPFFLLRFAQLTAYHDVGRKASGITDEIALHLVELLSPYGKIYISSERPLPSALKPYRLAINPLDIHHVMAFATLYVGDSQSMAVEAAMLGTPSVRFNDFVGHIGVLEELEQTYGLTIGIPTNNPQLLYDTVAQLATSPDIKAEYQRRRERMLADKMDVAAFITNFIENIND